MTATRPTPARCPWCKRDILPDQQGKLTQHTAPGQASRARCQGVGRDPRTCPDCNGTGWGVANGFDCPRCKGKGRRAS